MKTITANALTNPTSLLPNFLACLLALVLLSFSLVSYAQQNSDFNTPNIRINNSSLETTVVTATVTSRFNVQVTSDFLFRLWISIDDVFDESDLIFDTEAAGLERPAFFIDSFNFRLIEPEFFLAGKDLGEVSTFPRLNGDNRKPIEWIGETIHFKGCVMSVDGVTELTCRTIQTQISSYDLPLTAEKGVSRDQITLFWPAPPTDDGRLLVDSFELRETSTDFDNRNFNLAVEDLELDETTTPPSYKFSLAPEVAGRQYRYVSSTCLTLPSGVKECGRQSGFDLGSTFGDAIASEDFQNNVQISWDAWEVFAFNEVRYSITRCETTDFIRFRNCIQVGEKPCQAEINLIDENVVRGVSYQYEVTAFQGEGQSIGFDLTDGPQMPPIVSQCEGDAFFMARSNLGKIGLKDDFEDDNVPEDAFVTRRRVSQLRSMHIANDLDWVEIMIPRANALTIVTSGPDSRDTELTLYDAQLNELFYNDNPEGGGTVYAALSTPKLPAGKYFLKVNQKFDDDPFFYRPIPNYTLEIEFDGAVITAPIIQLLLDAP